MQNLYNELIELLEQDPALIIEDKLNKALIIDRALKLDVGLIKLLLGSPSIKKHFFQQLESIQVFDKIAFQRFVNTKQFLPDNYTQFKNKIGLSTNNENYLTDSREVVLVWPHKDCVLEGGQTKEDAKRDEIFYNQTLAPDDIDRLTAPKVLTSWKRYDKDGEHPVTKISKQDNLIIKGNNLVALHSLKEIYKGQVKLVFIDPPYNTGSDSFKYNDSFNQSTWLTFMRNRLQVAHKLLSEKGAIYVQIDHHQLGYLNVLMDEIFGIENKVQVIAIKTASPAGFKTVNPGPIDVTEYILFYTKNKSSFKFKKGYVPVDYNSNYDLYVEKNKDVSKWKFTAIKEKVINHAGYTSESDAKKKYGELWNSILKVMIADFAYKNSSNIVSIRDPHKPTEKLKVLMTKSKNEEKVIEYQREDGSIMYLYRGGALAFYSNKMQEIDGKMQVTELLTDFWGHISWAGIANEGGIKLKNGKKPEKLIKQIIELSTEENDIVLDFHLGSGTTAAVAHKMKRQYLGIEQLDYGDNDCVKRLKNVINGDSSGISKSVNWQGGGSFIYLELLKNNQQYIDEIQDATKTEQLKRIWEKMQQSAFISYKVLPQKINTEIKEFEALSFEEQQRFLVEVLDKNLLYVNFSEINDATHKVSDVDKELNVKFYSLLSK